MNVLQDSSWKAQIVQDTGQWVMTIDEASRQEMRRLAKVDTFCGIKEGATPWLKKLLTAALEELENGIGFLVLRDVPLLGLGLDEQQNLFTALCRQLGTLVPQTKEGQMISEVRHLAGDAAARIGRYYGSNADLGFHTDRCDVLALLFLQQSSEGGVSRICSSVTVHDELALHHPELLRELYKPFYWRNPELPQPGVPAFYQQPVFAVSGQRLACCFSRFRIAAGHRYPGNPGLTPLQLAALNAFEAIANRPDVCMEVRLQSGDLQLLNNHIVLHARSAYVDDDEHTRHLLRAWLSPPNSRALPPSFAPTFHDCRAGASRSGYLMTAHGSDLQATTH
jgi:hypothetical protein